MALDLKQHHPTSSYSSPSPGIQIKTETPDDYINEVPQDLRCRSNGGTDSNDERQPESDGNAKNLSVTAMSEDHNKSAEGLEESTTHFSRGDHEQDQRHLESLEDDSVYDKRIPTPVHTGELARPSSHDGIMEESRFPSAPGTPDHGIITGAKSTEDIMVSELFQPCRDRDGNLILDVDCGTNSGFLYINKLCRGSKGQSIYFNGKWYTPNEFQYISGRETAKDWKRSIRHRGKSLKILMSKGLLSVHTSAASECSNCKMNIAMSHVRYSDKKSTMPSTSVLQSSPIPSSTNMTVLDKSPKMPVAETDTSSLNQIISQLHQTNGFSSSSLDSSRKRALLLEMASEIKRPRSQSPEEDDIYIQEQRRIFQAANSPEPQMIENVRRSLNINTEGGGSGPPSPASLSPPSLEQVTSLPTDSEEFILRSPQTMSKHQNKSSRKQVSPQHLDLTISDRESANRSPHLLFSATTTSGNTGSSFHKQSVMRQRYHSQVYNLSRNSSSSLTTHETTSKRTQSLLTPTTKSSDTPMIELTRPDLVTPNGSTHSSTSDGGRSGGVTSTSQAAEDGPVTSRRLSANDTVFFPSDMSSWTVDDVVQFVQSLKGCEEYAQVFRDQAIDGEILPVLTEDHLLQNMGMKLGPALKIRLHIAKKLGFTLNGQYCTLKPPYVEVLKSEIVHS